MKIFYAVCRFQSSFGVHWTIHSTFDGPTNCLLEDETLQLYCLRLVVGKFFQKNIKG